MVGPVGPVIDALGELEHALQDVCCLLAEQAMGGYGPPRAKVRSYMANNTSTRVMLYFKVQTVDCYSKDYQAFISYESGHGP